MESPRVLPKLDDIIILDIETIIHSNFTWLIGVKLGKEMSQWQARDEYEQTYILQCFKEYLHDKGRYPIMVYSGNYFDIHTLIKTGKACGVDLEEEFMQRLILDACIEIRATYNSPVNYKLKNLGSYLGYRQKHAMNGYEVAKRYVRERHGLMYRVFLDEALEYNLDDILLVEYILRKLGNYFQFDSTLFIPTANSMRTIKTIKQESRIFKTADAVELYVHRSKIVTVAGMLLGVGGTIPKTKSEEPPKKNSLNPKKSSFVILYYTGLGKQLMERRLGLRRGPELWTQPLLVAQANGKK